MKALNKISLRIIISSIVIILIICVILIEKSVAANWGTFQADHCIRVDSGGIGIKQYSSRLWNIVGSWENACSRTSATINGQYFSRPNRCINKGFWSGMWGEFDVRDSSCNPYWGTFKRNKCTASGKGQYASVLHKITGSWENVCRTMPATVNRKYFSRPSRCINTGSKWGEFDDVPTSECFGNWGSLETGSCTGDGLQQYTARLWNIPSEFEWNYACYTTPATINGKAIPKPRQCLDYGFFGGIWGVFDAQSTSCDNYLTILVGKINDIVSGHSPVIKAFSTGADGTIKVSRNQLHINSSQFIHLDLGGEGFHEDYGFVSGFETAINVNSQTHQSQKQTVAIPRLVYIKNYNNPYPFADQFADYITLQGAPLTQHNVNEIARMLKPGGKVGLWIDKLMFQTQINDLARQLGDPYPTEVPIWMDEFEGKAGFRKIEIQNVIRDEF